MNGGLSFTSRKFRRRILVFLVGDKYPLAIPSLLLLLSLIAWVVHSFATSNRGMPRAVEGVARCSEVVGDVRVKTVGEGSWRQAGADELLQVGDLLFVGENSRARIEYLRRNASVTASRYSLFRIEERPPTLTQFRRVFGVEKKGGKGKSPALVTSGERVIARPDDIAMGALPSGDEDGDRGDGITLRQDVEPIEVVFPSSDVLLVAKRFPCSMPLQVGSRFRSTPRWAVLWDKEGDSVASWSQFGKGDVDRVPFRKPGRYLLQVVSDDEAFASRGIEIEVVQGGSSEMSERIPTLLPGRDVTVVIP